MGLRESGKLEKVIAIAKLRIEETQGIYGVFI
jgi:hypothetical protein